MDRVEQYRQIVQDFLEDFIFAVLNKTLSCE